MIKQTDIIYKKKLLHVVHAILRMAIILLQTLIKNAKLAVLIVWSAHPVLALSATKLTDITF